jgi:hypothetical protein
MQVSSSQCDSVGGRPVASRSTHRAPIAIRTILLRVRHFAEFAARFRQRSPLFCTLQVEAHLLLYSRQAQDGHKCLKN